MWNCYDWWNFKIVSGKMLHSGREEERRFFERTESVWNLSMEKRLQGSSRVHPQLLLRRWTISWQHTSPAAGTTTHKSLTKSSLRDMWPLRASQTSLNIVWFNAQLYVTLLMQSCNTQGLFSEPTTSPEFIDYRFRQSIMSSLKGRDYYCFNI